MSISIYYLIDTYQRIKQDKEMVSLLDSCGEGCGWTAAIIAILSWGSFGVPIRALKKSGGGGSVEVNFFVMQTYKTFVCFITSWFVILLGEEVRFTAWGIVSGLFWVPGAACGIYGIRNAGETFCYVCMLRMLI